MFNITLFKDARGIFTPLIMFKDSFIESVMKTIRHLFIHSHFVRILHRERASKINCGILEFSNAVAIYKAVAKGLKKN